MIYILSIGIFVLSYWLLYYFTGVLSRYLLVKWQMIRWEILNLGEQKFDMFGKEYFLLKKGKLKLVTRK